MKKMLLPLIAVCCLAPAAVFAAQQHPLVTDMAETVAPSKFEAETAVEYHSDSAYSAFVIQETISAGIIPKLDAFIAVPFASVKPDGVSRESGLNDVIIGAKYNFLNVDKTAFAVRPFIKLPTGDDDKGFGAGAVGFGASLIASIELDKQISFDANLLLDHQELSKGRDSVNTFGASVAGKLAVSNELKAVCELAVSDSDETGAKAESFATIGAIYAAQKNIDVDAGIRVGLTKDSEDIAVLAGLTFKF